MSDYDKRLFAYQMAMALARSMRSKGLITAREYGQKQNNGNQSREKQYGGVLHGRRF